MGIGSGLGSFAAAMEANDRARMKRDQERRQEYFANSPKGAYTNLTPIEVVNGEVAAERSDTDDVAIDAEIVPSGDNNVADALVTGMKLDGWSPKITGKNVLMEGVRDEVKEYAYPIMKKYGLTIRDGYRKTPGGGAKRSQHLSGNALDVDWNTVPKEKRADIINEFKKAGFKGFGIGPTSLHIDRRKNPAAWSYYGGTATGGGTMPTYATDVLKGWYR